MQKGQTPKGVATASYKTYCAAGDPVCQNGSDVSAHLSYGSDTGDAASFIASHVQ